MDISIYFEPLDFIPFESSDHEIRHRLGDHVTAYTTNNELPDFISADLAIVGVKEERNAKNNLGCSEGPDHIRKALYQLFRGDYKPNIVDLGNIRNGHAVEDTYFALAAVVTELIKNNTIPIILGGSQDLTFANYRAYESLGKVMNILAIDSMFDLGNADQEIHSKGYLNKIILHQPNFLFNYTNVGYQTYLVDPESIKLMDRLYFATYRIGKVRTNLENVEPLTRNADMITVDISAIKHADAPANPNASPNGFYGEEVCQIMRYAGISDKLSSIGFYELNPSLDINDQTAKLVAQMIWYFIEGFYNRKNDHPYKNIKEYIKYTVSIKDHKDQLVFYKSKKSDRWWMDVPVKNNLKDVYERHHLVPCSYADYEVACHDDIPDRWWQAYQKLM